MLKNCNRAIIIENGKKTFDGDVKTGVEKYKKIIVGISEDEEKIEEIEKDEKNNLEIVNNSEKIDNEKEWKINFIQNPNITEYGNKKAEVIDYGMFDIKGNSINAFDNGEEVILKSKIRFNEAVKDPIFTMTLKDFSGNDIAGTNTDIEKVMTGNYKKGDIAVVTFKQKIPVSCGKYTLSFSCTKYNLKGELEVLNRKYDALLIEAITTKNTVGLIRIDSEITINKLGEN